MYIYINKCIYICMWLGKEMMQAVIDNVNMVVMSTFVYLRIHWILPDSGDPVVCSVMCISSVLQRYHDR